MDGASRMAIAFSLLFVLGICEEVRKEEKSLLALFSEVFFGYFIVVEGTIGIVQLVKWAWYL
jgi:hypothetical protein